MPIAGPQPPALQFDGAPGDSQAQAEACATVGQALVGLENALKVGIRYAWPLVAQAQVPACALAPAIKADPAFGRRVANGIAQQVFQGLGQTVQMSLQQAVSAK
ncbi:hypothetical protein D9M71_303020 [compost metagenome]